MVECSLVDKSEVMTNHTAGKLQIIKNNNSAQVKNCNRSTAYKNNSFRRQKMYLHMLINHSKQKN